MVFNKMLTHTHNVALFNLCFLRYPKEMVKKKKLKNAKLYHRSEIDSEVT